MSLTYVVDLGLLDADSDRPAPYACRVTPRVYLDHAATTQMVSAAVEALTAELQSPGNASSLHASGRRARRVVEESRERMAAALDCRPGEIVFTSGGTEADNLAIKGLAWARDGQVVTSAIEHHAVLDPVDWLAEHDGTPVRFLDVDDLGRVDPKEVDRALAGTPTAVVSVMWANNEVGTLQPIQQVVASAHAHDVPVHTDAVQAIGAVPVSFAASGVDAMSVSGHKVGGPVGVGALVARRELALQPLLHGGGQEREVRSGTLDVAGVAALAVAVDLAVADQHQHASHLAGLRDRLEAGILALLPGTLVNGDQANRLPGIAHLSFPGCEGDALLMLLDAQGVECSTGSACSAGVPQPSHVLIAMGRDDATARASLRFSVGRTNTEADIDRVLAVLPDCVARAQEAGRRR
ncbi:MAG: cysteine desulfurase family protein [Nocardioides sp.]